MVESILRSSKYKTGLFTSPHLFDVRERIRINGCILSFVISLFACESSAVQCSGRSSCSVSQKVSCIKQPFKLLSQDF